ncbi:4'-phosphopantetheinyl transferase family protein [Micromonospora sp. DT227]|uniref:4'-phosphopantetheinyl transferase family protein n=1 Tax=Micromonospora sp. DT227 TaxID=3393433 RepID=UPI003CEDB98A
MPAFLNGQFLRARLKARPAGAAVAPIDCHKRCIDPADAHDWCEDPLSESEWARAGSRRRVAARRRLTTATPLLKATVAESADDDPRKVKLRRECPDCRGPHGHPEVVGSTLNVSCTHAGDMVAVALCADAAVGVDVGQAIADVDVDVDSMLGLVLGDAQRADFRAVHGRRARIQAFFHCWTRKESALRATGDGLRVPMSNVTVWASHDLVRERDGRGSVCRQRLCPLVRTGGQSQPNSPVAANDTIGRPRHRVPSSCLRSLRRTLDRVRGY